MSDKPFDRVIVNPLERPISDEHAERPQRQADLTLREVLMHLFPELIAYTTGRAGFIGSSFEVSGDAAAMQVHVRKGIGFIYYGSDVPADDPHPYKPVMLWPVGSADITLAIAANGSGNPRYDIVEVTRDRHGTDNVNRDVLNTTTGVFVATLLDTTLTHEVRALTSIKVKQGTPAALPAPPTVDADYELLATVYVPSAALSIPLLNVADRRKLLLPGNVCARAQAVISAGVVSYSERSPGMDLSAANVAVGNDAVRLWGAGIQATGDPAVGFTLSSLLLPRATHFSRVPVPGIAARNYDLQVIFGTNVGVGVVVGDGINESMGAPVVVLQIVGTDDTGGAAALAAANIPYMLTVEFAG